MAKARVSSLTNRINRLGPNATNRAALEQRLSVAQSEADAAQAKTDAIRLPDQTAIPEAPAVSTKPPAVSDLQYVKLNARDPVTKRIRDEDRGHMAVRYETPDGVINVGEIIDHRAAYGDTTTSQPWETSDGQRHMNLALAKKHELVTQVIPKLQRDGYLAPEAPPAAATAPAAKTEAKPAAPTDQAPTAAEAPDAWTVARKNAEIKADEISEAEDSIKRPKTGYLADKMTSQDAYARHFAYELSRETTPALSMEEWTSIWNDAVDAADDKQQRAQKAEPAAPPAKAPRRGDFNPATFIKIAADDVARLRASDVDRLFAEVPSNPEAWDALSRYLLDNRPDLAEVVREA